MTSSPKAGTSPNRDSLSEEEFADLFQGSIRLLWTVAVGVVGDRGLADDVLQEACIVGLSKRAAFERGTSFEAWMGRTVRLVALNLMRHRARRRARPLEGAELGADYLEAPGPSFSAPPVYPDGRLAPDLGAFDDQLVGALMTLSPTARACLLLRVLRGLDYSELSQVLNIPEGTAMSHVHRARTSLRRALSAEDSVPAPAQGGAL